MDKMDVPIVPFFPAAAMLAHTQPTHWYWVGLVYLELRWFVFIAMHSPRQQVQEYPQKIKVHASNVRYLEYWANPEEAKIKRHKSVGHSARKPFLWATATVNMKLEHLRSKTEHQKRARKSCIRWCYLETGKPENSEEWPITCFTFLMWNLLQTWWHHPWLAPGQVSSGSLATSGHEWAASWCPAGHLVGTCRSWSPPQTQGRSKPGQAQGVLKKGGKNNKIC